MLWDTVNLHVQFRVHILAYVNMKKDNFKEHQGKNLKTTVSEQSSYCIGIKVRRGGKKKKKKEKRVKRR